MANVAFPAAALAGELGVVGGLGGDPGEGAGGRGGAQLRTLTRLDRVGSDHAMLAPFSLHCYGWMDVDGNSKF